MQTARNLFTGNHKYMVGLILLCFISVICVAYRTGDADDFDQSKREILLRKIAHELLLKSGDRTSRVLPVKKIDENEYQISFEHQFSFLPDALVNTTRRLLAHDPLTKHYVVNVRKSGSTDVIYGYAISKNKHDDIISCKGRMQPKAAYLINIKFKPSGSHPANKEYLLGSLSFLAFVGFVVLKSAKPIKSLSDDLPADVFRLGSILFNEQQRTLQIDENTIYLTGTETRVLSIFARQPNQTIERSRLQKEIWEDEGVIVGRSLDMFISKLRKKLEVDPLVNILVIRGKGYKLEIGT
ncbi:winged helix-turn-helix domain-containing protein [Pedobacter sp. BMA]|uniref:winged helix-turn-helix domain-containing protein n=1 Tax=Pedobacter sp. BMA TaxID=1663685 RepID=UPI000649C1D3|nr:winged helix-turn-helix domain-containing protein [Pedobacter sp. BMA]KLT63746.1 transcriptional regulator [Pedobacter sp. BMA]